MAAAEALRCQLSAVMAAAAAAWMQQQRGGGGDGGGVDGGATAQRRWRRWRRQLVCGSLAAARWRRQLGGSGDFVVFGNSGARGGVHRGHCGADEAEGGAEDIIF